MFISSRRILGFYRIRVFELTLIQYS